MRSRPYGANDEWTERAVAGSKGSARATFFANEPGGVVGLVGGYRDGSPDGRVELVSTWVAPTRRRIGVGRALVDAVIAWTQRQVGPTSGSGLPVGTARQSTCTNRWASLRPVSGNHSLRIRRRRKQGCSAPSANRRPRRNGQMTGLWYATDGGCSSSRCRSVSCSSNAAGHRWSSAQVELPGEYL